MGSRIFFLYKIKKKFCQSLTFYPKSRQTDRTMPKGYGAGGTPKVKRSGRAVAKIFFKIGRLLKFAVGTNVPQTEVHSFGGIPNMEGCKK